MEQYGIINFEKNDYFLNHYLYLTNKHYIYELENFNKKILYKTLVNMLQKFCIENNCQIEFSIFWETNDTFGGLIGLIKGYQKNGYFSSKVMGIYADSVEAATLTVVTGAWIKGEALNYMPMVVLVAIIIFTI